MDTTDGFVPITAMFYSVFHPTEGTKVIHQVPSGVIVPPSNDDNRINNNLPDSSAFDQPLFDFDIVKNYVIPKPSLCNKLITLKIDKYRIVGFPVNIYAPHYARNSFGFNFCFVFNYESNTTPYEGSVKRIGKMFRALEEQSQLLSKSLKDSHIYYQQISQSQIQQNQQQQNKKSTTYALHMNNKYLKIVDDWDDASQQLVLQKQTPGLVSSSTQKIKISSIESLIQQIFQDLNNYSECMIPIDASNSVDLKLFPISPPPPQVCNHDVPIALVKLDSLFDSLWDPTMLKIVPFINGINSISQISILANTSLDLTKECIRHLLHYKSISILDIFQFSNHYVATSSISDFLKDSEMAKKCQDYVLSIKGVFNGLPLEPLNHRNSNSNSVNSKLDTLNTLHTTSNTINTTTSNNNNNLTSNQISASYSSLRTPRKPPLLTMESISSNYNISSKNQQTNKIILPSKATLFQLYNSLNSNMSVSQWYSENEKLLENIDIRKFITFGIRNGIIARVHKYPVYGRLAIDNNEPMKSGTDTDDLDSSAKISTNFNISSLPILSTSRIITESKLDRIRKFNKQESTIESDEDRESDSTDSGSSDSSEDDEDEAKAVTTRHEEEDQFMDAALQKKNRKEKAQEQKLIRLMKHVLHMDSICTSMHLSNKEVHSILERIGEIEMIER